jgi:hypothetical protein
MSSVLEFVEFITTSGATPLLCASFHLREQTHHLSFGFSPGNEGGEGVIRLFPFDFVNSRNFFVITAQTVCVPVSSGPVLQNPSR